MKIKVLGAHNSESRYTRLMSLLVDNILALDAGGLTSNLSFASQMKLKAVFLTHGHYDHIRDIPALAMNLFLREKSINIYTHQAVYDNITQYLLNGKLYPEFCKRPPDDPTLKIHILEPYQKVTVEGYEVLPVPVIHAIPAMGYQISSAGGKSIFYTGDTGVNLSETWKYISPQVLFIELTSSNRWEESMLHHGHLDPNLLTRGLLSFREMKGYLPQIIVAHMNFEVESEIKSEISRVEEDLGVPVTLAYEGMQIEI
jgi:ribonuclease BN (tRNA processing enzyme)